LHSVHASVITGRTSFLEAISIYTAAFGGAPSLNPGSS
jgi:hypothetical protein